MINNNNVLLVGSGGHASVLLDMLIELKINVLGYVSQIPASNKNLFLPMCFSIIDLTNSSVTLKPLSSKATK